MSSSTSIADPILHLVAESASKSEVEVDLCNASPW